jgi:hypothetical protein
MEEVLRPHAIAADSRRDDRWHLGLVHDGEPETLIERDALTAAFEPPVRSPPREHRPHEFRADAPVARIRTHDDRIDEHESGLQLDELSAANELSGLAGDPDLSRHMCSGPARLAMQSQDRFALVLFGVGDL